MAKTSAGIGYSEQRDSFKAGGEAASAALDRLGGPTGSLALAFCTGRHDSRECFNGIRSALGESIPVIGGSAIGLITAEHLGYEGHQVGVALLPADVGCVVESSGPLVQGEITVGRNLARALRKRGNGPGRLDLLFYETVRKAPPPCPEMNISSLLLEGYREFAGDEPPMLVGAGLVGGYDLKPGFQFTGREVGVQSAVAAALHGDFEASVTVMHGCKPMSDYHRITRVQGNVIYEIDNLPALDVVLKLLGHRQWEENLPLLLITLGVNLGEKYAPYDEKKYLNRLIVGYIPQERAIVMFEADLKRGDEFRFMRRNEELMMQSAEKGCREIRERLRQENREPFFALYMDCAGRTRSFSGGEREEAEIIQQAIGRDIPLLGFYSGVEIAPLMGVSRGLDWTGVLLVLSRGKE